ncbi:hypothetical protein B1R32_102134 [Abditibacterium utsteinense]|uniref:WD40-like Beta Propeller Repeat n=1 Tax=Abditibacterium utsteinense TaxID=1960156 RepID=A0A2S8SWG6_9BACT|nr:WD40 repeat domain-containing protein [Abditibacterium utsteinense]PQV65127.1 hypothetical protein B1R32_102134 [Abditibacterium utsteinense]
MKQAWTRGEKMLWATPLLFGVVAVAAKFGPDVVERTLGRPQRWNTAPDNDIRSMALSRNGEVLAVSGSLRSKSGRWKPGSGTIYFWNARTGARLSPFLPVYTRDKTGFTHGFDIYALKLSPDAKQIGFSRVHQNWALYNVATRKQLWSFPQFISDAEFSCDGRFIALSVDADVFIVGASDGRVRAHWKRRGSPNSQDLAWAPDGKIVADIGSYDENDPIELRQAADGKLVRRIQRKYASSVAFSPNGKRLVVAAALLEISSSQSLDSFAPVRCYEVATGALKWEVKATSLGGTDFQHAAFCDAVFSPDGRTIAVYQYNNRRVLLLDSTTGKTKKILNLGRAEPTPFFVPPALAFSPDGKRLFARGRSAVLVWDLE